MDDLFLNFDNIPLATASIAQVHRATLRDGQDVVVKVQHEGIKEIILEDLKNAKSIVDWIAWAEPQYNFSHIIDEWCKEAPKGLDFNIEAENTREVSRNLGCKSNSDDNDINRVDVLIPEIIMSTEKVLILEYMDGVRLNDSMSLQEMGVDKQKLVEEITRAYAHQIYVDGFFNGDPHPGNFLVSKASPHRPILLDFGLTKRLPSSFKQALAKMFLASAEGDHVALLSSLEEMGLKLRLDVPEHLMKITNVFFRTSAPANEATKTLKDLARKRDNRMKFLQEKMKLNAKQVKRFNPVDAFPGDIVIFSRVINLLRESVLQCNVNKGPATNPNWMHTTPILSNVENKLRKLLIELGNADKVLGIQVCAYRDGEVIIDTAAGILGRYDPRPVQPDSLFPVFSASKGITAGMIHWLVDKGKLDLVDKVENIWPEFGSGKDKIKVHHVLNHTSGLQNAMSSVTHENPLLLTDWDECLNCITKTVPETEPGAQQFYHYVAVLLSLINNLIIFMMQHASSKKFQEILEKAFIQPLNINGELYIGIPPGILVGVESRLATLTSDMEDIKRLSEITQRPDIPANFQSQIQDASEIASAIPALFNTLFARRAIIPAANAHSSARALARYYAALVDQGAIPPPHASPAQPKLGSHPHIPKFTTLKSTKKRKGALKKDSRAKYTKVPTDDASSSSSSSSVARGEHGNDQTTAKLFTNRRIHDAFVGAGEYEKLTLPGGQFGLGFKRSYSEDGKLIGFGHSGIGGSTGYCDIDNRFSISITLNKLNMGGVTAKIMQLVCSELNIPLPADFYRFSERLGDDYSNIVPLIS
ncbi:hypothetical protein SASPL_153055 [Salvia splendens]|uniref:Ubiquinone biosynthesis protein n=1 Tax=Salvia splendens TaxID=180675 RepID=A0A8X8W4G6_SALSN|nr:hypothetical protein SASPL_153055 [Salvia splendens]